MREDIADMILMFAQPVLLLIGVICLFSQYVSVLIEAVTGSNMLGKLVTSFIPGLLIAAIVANIFIFVTVYIIGLKKRNSDKPK